MANNEYDTADKILTLEQLLRVGEPIDCALIMSVQGVSESCARNRLKYLRDTHGADLVRVRDGKRVYYRLRNPDAPSVEDITRAASAKFGEITLDVFRGTKYHREAQHASKQERTRLVPDSVEHLDRLVRGLYRRTQGPSDYRHKRMELEVWLDGIRFRRRLRMSYRRSDGQEKEYIIDPLVLVLYQDRLHLLSRRPADDEYRTFNLDGVLKAELLEESYLPPAPGECEAAEIFANSFGIFSDVAVASILIHLRQGARVRCEQRPIHPSQREGSVLDDGWREFRYMIAICPEFRAFLLGLMPDVRIIEPTELREQLAQAMVEGLRILDVSGS